MPDLPDVIVIAANRPRDDRLRGRRRRVTSAETQAPQAAAEVRKFPLTTLTTLIAMVVESMVGAGAVLLANGFTDLIPNRLHR